MYLDTVVVSGLIIVALCCVMTAYVCYHAYKHIAEDSRKHAEKERDSQS